VPVYEVRWAHDRQERRPVLAQELVELTPDVIWTGVSLTAPAAERATSIIPIVFAQSGDPVGFGLAESLARPGGNAVRIESSVRHCAQAHRVVASNSAQGSNGWRFCAMTIPQSLLLRADEVIE
jgi:ABC-type uncharacterized transport system substrate-binding protein